MKVVVIGADPSVPRLLKNITRQRGLSGITIELDRSGDPAGGADWVFVTSADDRIRAIARFGLPPHRVLLVVPSELRNGSSEDALGTALARVAVIGARRPHVSKTGVSFAKRLLAWAEPRIHAYVLADTRDDGPAPAAQTDKAVRSKKPAKLKPPPDERVARFTALARRWDGPEGSR